MAAIWKLPLMFGAGSAANFKSRRVSGARFSLASVFRWDEVDACNVIQPGKMLHLLEDAHSSWWKMLLF